MDPSPKTYTHAINRSRPLPVPPSAAPPFDPITIEHSSRKQSLSPPPPFPPSPPPSPPSQSPVALPSGSPPTYSALIMPSPKQNPHSSFVVSNPWQKMSVAQQLYANSLMNHGPSLPTLPPPSFESNAPMTVPNQESFYQTSVSSCIPSVRLPPSSLSTVSSISSSQSSQTTFPHQTYNIASFMPQSPPYSEHSFSDDDQHLDGVNLNRTPLPRGDIEPDVPHLTPMPQPKRNTVFNHNLNPPTRTLFDLKYVNAGENKPKAVRNVITSIHPPPDPGGGEKVHVDQNMPDELFLHQTLLSPPSGGTIVPEKREPAHSSSFVLNSSKQVLSPPPPPILLNVPYRSRRQQESLSSVHYQIARHQNGDNTDEQVQANNQCPLPEEGSQQLAPANTLPRGAGQPHLVHRASQALSHPVQLPTYDPYHHH